MTIVDCRCPAGLVATTIDAGPKVVRGIERDLEQFCALLVKWQAAQNLVSRETLAVFWPRHILDSLQLLKFVSGRPVTIMDLGSGGGLPALPMAIAFKHIHGDKAPRLHLVESNGRKVAFLRTVGRELGLTIQVHSSRIEKIDSRETGPANLITARALAPLKHLFSYSFPLLAPDGRMLFLKGREYGEEVAEAGADWAFDVVIHESESDRDGVVLDIGQLRPKPR